MWDFSGASSGSSSGQRFFCILCVRLRMSWLVVLLGSAFGVLALGCFQVFPCPPLSAQGSQGPSFIVFPLNSLFSVTGA